MKNKKNFNNSEGVSKNNSEGASKTEKNLRTAEIAEGASKTEKNSHTAETAEGALKRKIILCFAIISTACAIVLAFKVVPHVSDLNAIRREQKNLPNLSPFDESWREINPDYVGWLQIEGTIINFPVVRANDNRKYLTKTFRGEENIVGAIFMDYRIPQNDAPHLIIYGHDVTHTNGEYLMFGGLHKFLSEDYRAENPTIAFMENNRYSEYEIFAARLTNIHDAAYRVRFDSHGSFETFLERIDAPRDTQQIITLSTCVGVGNDFRMIVQGALKNVFETTSEYDENAGWQVIMPQ